MRSTELCADTTAPWVGGGEASRGICVGRSSGIAGLRNGRRKDCGRIVQLQCSTKHQNTSEEPVSQDHIAMFFEEELAEPRLFAARHAHRSYDHCQPFSDT